MLWHRLELHVSARGQVRVAMLVSECVIILVRANLTYCIARTFCGLKLLRIGHHQAVAMLLLQMCASTITPDI